LNTQVESEMAVGGGSYRLAGSDRKAADGSNPLVSADRQRLEATIAQKGREVVNAAVDACEAADALASTLARVLAFDADYQDLLRLADLPAPKPTIAELLADAVLARGQILAPRVPGRIAEVGDRADAAIRRYARPSAGTANAVLDALAGIVKDRHEGAP
jgi:hypothetical protein